MSFAASSTPTPEAAIAGMLAVLRVMAERFTAAFGGPAALITGGAVYGKTRERILRWLHDMESVVRRLLLLRAALYPTPTARGFRQHAPGRVRRANEGAAETLFGPSADPAQWRVSFRMPTPPEPLWMSGGFRAHEDPYDPGNSAFAANAASADTCAGQPTADSAAGLKSTGYYWVDDPRPLAERFEALRRVIEDHEHYAARLAQRLYAWRGREERRRLFLTSLCAITPKANEAGLSDAEWEAFAEARAMARALFPVFSATLERPKAQPRNAAPPIAAPSINAALPKVTPAPDP